MSAAPLPSGAQTGGERMSLRARWVFPVGGRPLENGTVEITAGRISAIHVRPGRCSYDLGNAAIIPGLVNAHAHLELSDVAAPLQPAAPFTAWLKEVLLHRRERASPSAANNRVAWAAIGRGQAESVDGGTTAIGDIVGEGWTSEAVETQSQRVVAFLECLGLAPERAPVQLESARRHLEGKSHVVRGLSPHAPYSVHPDLFRGLVDLAVQYQAPVAMHLAETQSERQLLLDGTGEFLSFLEGLGVWRADAIPRGMRPLDYLRELARAKCALAIHGNYLADDEVEFLAAHSNISVVYCPRTHAFFRHETHPWQRLLARNINVAVGTDSRASNPDLGLWHELLFLHSIVPDIDPSRLLRMGTINGASALGMQAEIGTLEIGKSADLAVVSLGEGHATDPSAILFYPENRIAAVMSAGIWQKAGIFL